MTPSTPSPAIKEREAELQEQAALVWTLRSQARVGSYQHELSSAPWRILGAEESRLRHLRATHLQENET